MEFSQLRKKKLCSKTDNLKDKKEIKIKTTKKDKVLGRKKRRYFKYRHSSGVPPQLTQTHTYTHLECQLLTKLTLTIELFQKHFLISLPYLSCGEFLLFQKFQVPSWNVIDLGNKPRLSWWKRRILAIQLQHGIIATALQFCVTSKKVALLCK